MAVTGAGGGIGRALACEAIERGAVGLALIDANLSAAEAAAVELRSPGVLVGCFECDVSDVDHVDEVAGRVVAEIGLPQVVCANAGIGPRSAPVLDLDPDDLRWALEVNVVGTWATLRSFGHRLVNSGQPGWLLVTGSEHSVGVPFPGQAAYTISKHATLGLADVLRRELPDHVGVSVMIPGLVATELWRSTESRPDRLGDPVTNDPFVEEVMRHGMAPSELAALAFDGIARGGFLIATHNHVQRYADERQSQIAEAFAATAGSPPLASQSYAIDEVVERLLTPNEPSAGAAPVNRDPSTTNQPVLLRSDDTKG